MLVSNSCGRGVAIGHIACVSVGDGVLNGIPGRGRGHVRGGHLAVHDGGIIGPAGDRVASHLGQCGIGRNSVADVLVSNSCGRGVAIGHVACVNVSDGVVNRAPGHGRGDRRGADQAVIVAGQDPIGVLITGHVFDRGQEVCHGLVDVRVGLRCGRNNACRSIHVNVSDSHIRDVINSVKGDAVFVDRGDLAHVVGCAVGSRGPVRERMAGKLHGGSSHRFVSVTGDGNDAVTLHRAIRQRSNEGAALRVEVHSDFVGHPVGLEDHGNAFGRAVEDLVVIQNTLDVPDLFRRGQVFIEMIAGLHGRCGNQFGRDLLIHSQIGNIHVRLAVDGTAVSVEAHGQRNRRVDRRDGQVDRILSLGILDDAVLRIYNVIRTVIPAVEGVAGDGHIFVCRQVNDLTIGVGLAVADILAVQTFDGDHISDIRPVGISADIICGHCRRLAGQLNAVLIIGPAVKDLAGLLERGAVQRVISDFGVVGRVRAGHVSGRCVDRIVIIVNRKRIRIKGDRDGDVRLFDVVHGQRAAVQIEVVELAQIIRDRIIDRVGADIAVVIGQNDGIINDQAGIIRQLSQTGRCIDIFIMHAVGDRFVARSVGRVADDHVVRVFTDRIGRICVVDPLLELIAALFGGGRRRHSVIVIAGSGLRLLFIREGHGIRLRHIVEGQLQTIRRIDDAGRGVAALGEHVMLVDRGQLRKGDIIGIRFGLCGHCVNDLHRAAGLEGEAGRGVDRGAAVGQIGILLVHGHRVVRGHIGCLVANIRRRGNGADLVKGVVRVSDVDPLVKVIAGLLGLRCGRRGRRLIVNGGGAAEDGRAVLFVEGDVILISRNVDVERICRAGGNGHARVRLRGVNGEVLGSGVVSRGAGLTLGGHACRGHGDDCAGRRAGIGRGRGRRPGAVRILNVNVQRDGGVGIFIDRVVNDVIRIREELVCKIRSLKKFIVAGGVGIRGPAEEVLAFLHGISRRGLSSDRGADNAGRGRGRFAANGTVNGIKGHGAVDGQGGIGVGIDEVVLSGSVGCFIKQPVTGVIRCVSTVAIVSHTADIRPNVPVFIAVWIFFSLIMRLVCFHLCG